MENGSIPDNRITASSEYSSTYSPRKGRLNNNGYWGPISVASQWFQVDLQEQVQIEGVIIQGVIDPNYDPQWVTAYQVQYSVGKITWQYVVGVTTPDTVQVRFFHEGQNQYHLYSIILFTPLDTYMCAGLPLRGASKLN